MPSDSIFRLSTTLALGLACACVGYAEWEMMPEVAAIAAGVIVALIVLYRLETRVELLAVPAANRLGLYLAVATIVWGGCRLSWEYKHDEFRNTPWQFMLAAMFGPLLICAIPAKLARREKHAGDYWSLHAMGLFAVCLAGAILQDWVGFEFILLYSIATVWSLGLLHLRQASGTLSAQPVAIMDVEPAVGQVPGRLRVRAAGASLVAAAALAVPLYLVTPRSPADKLSFGQPRIEIGFAADQMTDLRNTGELKANPETAFEVTAEVEGRPWPNLPAEQRWYGRILREYRDGVWRTGEAPLPGLEPLPLHGGHWRLPDLGPGQIVFGFSVRRDLHAQFLADPVVWAAGQPVPVANLTPSGPEPWTDVRNGAFFSETNPASVSTLPLKYVQVWRPQTDPNLSPPFRLTDTNSNLEDKLRPLRTGATGAVKAYAAKRIEELIESGELPADCRDPVHLFPRPRYHDQIARSFAAYLSFAPDLRYSTVLKRTRKDIDPVEDFLLHTKSGHCERFASALAMMLRSQGIPAVLVLGFKGCEPGNEPGTYVVREDQAHAWVAALIQDFGPPVRGDSQLVSRWRSLDPYPSIADEGGDLESAWTTPVVSWFRSNYRTYIANFTPDERRRTLQAIADWSTQPEVLATAAFAAVLVLGLRFWLRRAPFPPPIPSPHATWFGRLATLLAERGYSPRDGETPLEFATRVRDELLIHEPTRAVADVPVEWMETYYELRYGDRLIDPARQAVLDGRLDELMLAMKSRG